MLQSLVRNTGLTDPRVNQTQVQPEIDFSFVVYRKGSDDAAVKKRVDRMLAQRFPAVEAKTEQQFKDQISSGLRRRPPKRSRKSVTRMCSPRLSVWASARNPAAAMQ